MAFPNLGSYVNRLTNTIPSSDDGYDAASNSYYDQTAGDGIPTITLDRKGRRVGLDGVADPAAAASTAASGFLGALGKANPYLAVGSLVLGGVQAAIAARKLRQLDKNKPAGYQITPEEQEVFNRTKEAARYGFSQQEKDAYLGNIAKQQEVNYQRSLSAGGGSLAGALGASTSRADLSGFATSDAQIKRQAEGRYQQALMGKSRKRDLMAEQALSDYAKKQQAWGGALQAGLENVTNVANLAMATGYSNNT